MKPTMDLDHWKQLDSLLQSVLERPLEERDAFLRRACAGNEPLERQLRALLSAEPQAKNLCVCLCRHPHSRYLIFMGQLKIQL